jgi:hypothetical protein
MPDPDFERETNRALVEAARVELTEAARNLTSDIEPASIFSVAPHQLLEDEEQE